MCGIAGILDRTRPPDAALAAAMAEVLRHRGPDQAGSFADDRCALAMRRLAVQDVVHGCQPAFSEDRQVAVVLNGELYDFRALRAELEAAGHRLASASDTEVLPHLYEEHGDAFLSRLRGMFALALWDARRGRLLLARDRLGKKPLYLTHHRGSLRFASEIKALFADRSVPREPDLEALHHYLCLQYVPAPWTAFAGIRALPPAHLLVADADGERVERWWDLPAEEPRRDVGRSEAAGLVREAVGDAVRARLVADVPVGAFLSGGVDSACVVAAMSEASSRPVRTFTIGFRDQARDERGRARLTAQALGTDHTEVVVDPDVAGLLPLLAWHYDQPFADHSCLPTYAVARETRAHVTVALNGDGGDEAFAGYPRVQRLARLAARPPAAAALGRLAGRATATQAPASPLALAGRLAQRHLGPLADVYVADAQLFPEAWLRASYAPAMAAATRGVSNAGWLTAALGEGGDPVWRGQVADYRTYLPGALLPKVDVATMAVGLEARSPLLDHEVVELAATLPTATKVGNGGAKLALRDAFRGVVPDAVLDGPKQGFRLPLEGWLQGELAPLVRGLLLAPGAAVATILRPDAIARLVRSHQHTGRHATRLFALLSLELWHRTFVAAPPPLVPPAAVTVTDLS